MKTIFVDLRIDDKEIQNWLGKCDFADSPSDDYDSVLFELGLTLRFTDSDRYNGVKLIEHYSQLSKRVYVVETELNDALYYFITTCELDNVYFVCPGAINHPRQKNVIHYGWHLNATRKVYKTFTPKLDTEEIKSKYFDVLLGTKKPHRDFINEYVAKNLMNETYLTYSDKDMSKFDLGVSIIPSKQVDAGSSTENLVIGNKSVRISMLIPDMIYAKTAYSVVAETFVDNEFSFFTEKVAKPILAKRLFIVFSGQHYLRNLKSLGFKTFKDVVDESYDSIEDNELRWGMAAEQMANLCRCSQRDVLHYTQQVREHNYQLLMSGELDLTPLQHERCQ
jgi:hypothetical protein